MRAFAFASALLGFAALNPAYAGEAGVGVIVAEPTGIGAKLWLNETEAIDGAAAWWLDEDDAVQLHADYLLHRFGVFNEDQSYGRLPFYFGIGARALLDDGNDGRGRGDGDDRFGVRIPLGLTYLFARAPFDLFGEIVPVMDLAPSTDLDITAAIGGRFYFGRREQLRRDPVDDY